MNTVLIIIGAVVALFIILVVYSRMKMKGLENVPTNEAILILTDKNFNHQLKGKLVLVDFWAEWCGPCRMVSPIVEEIAKENTAFKVGKVNVDDQQALAQQYGVRSIPTLIVFKKGSIYKTAVGARPKESILQMID